MIVASGVGLEDSYGQAPQHRAAKPDMVKIQCWAWSGLGWLLTNPLAIYSSASIARPVRFSWGVGGFCPVDPIGRFVRTSLHSANGSEWDVTSLPLSFINGLHIREWKRPNIARKRDDFLDPRWQLGSDVCSTYSEARFK